MNATHVILIFDIGKTNKKLLLFDEAYNMVYESIEQFQEIKDEDGFDGEDIIKLKGWMLNSFAEIMQNKAFEIKAIKEGAQRELPVMTGAQFIMRALQRDFADMGDQQLKATASEIARVLTTSDPTKLQKIAKELAGNDIRTVLRKEAPEVLPILGRALLGPFSIGSMSGNIAPNINQMATGMLSGQ